MAKYQDRTKCEHYPEVSRYKRGEYGKVRHLRRLNLNKSRLDIFRKWCKEKGIEFRCLNHGEHWQMKVNGDCYDWWPRTAKLVINQKWKQGIHVHDYTQIMKILER